MNKKMKTMVKKIQIASFFFLLSFLCNQNLEILFCILSYGIVGLEILKKAIRNLLKGKVLDENFLMAVATIGAFGIGEFQEAVAVMLFYQIGEVFQKYAIESSRKSITELMNIRPDYANLCEGKKITQIDPKKVKIGDILLIKPGEKVPLDGIVIEGTSTLNLQTLTGESIPKKITVQEEILSGSINKEGTLKIKVCKIYQESTAQKILDLVENAMNKKAKAENFICKFAKYYTPIVVVVALFLALIPPIMNKDSFVEWIYRSFSFLVISCPCALVISIPLSFFGGIGACSKRGILVKGSNYIEALAKTEMIVCDKTGTLTEGVFKIQQIEQIKASKEQILKYAAYAEFFSTHPIATFIKNAYEETIDQSKIEDVKEIAGKGIIAKIEGKNICVGNDKWMEEQNIPFEKREKTAIYIACNKELLGVIKISDTIKKDAYKAIEQFKKNSIKVFLLTGDKKEVSQKVAKQLQIDAYYAELLPQDKVRITEELLKEKSPKRTLLFVGDGMNDAPVLALADVGIAMGGVGSDAAIEAADVVIMDDQVSKVMQAISISKKTMQIVKQNIFLALFVKGIVLFLSAFGLTTMWLSVFADVGVSILAIINALRILIFQKKGR